MYIDADTIIKAAALVGAVMTIGGIVFGVMKWVLKQGQNDEELTELRNTHEEDVNALREELCILSYASLATLDGLKQLNCNGKVTEAHEKLSKHINKQAHDQL